MRKHKPSRARGQVPKAAYDIAPLHAVPLPVRSSFNPPVASGQPSVYDRPETISMPCSRTKPQPSIFNNELTVTTRAKDKTGNAGYTIPSKRAGKRAGRCAITTFYNGIRTWSNTK